MDSIKAHEINYIIVLLSVVFCWFVDTSDTYSCLLG